MTHQQELVERFKAQTEFATGYSDLYASLFNIIGKWIEDGSEIGPWLIEVSKERSPFDVTLLTMAGLHESVLSQHPATAKLSAYYPSVGGTQPADEHLSAILAEAMPNLKEIIGRVIKTATVQTNETGRGSIWLMPLTFTGWDEVELLDLGASAGLNLLAGRRCYEFVSANSGKPIVQLGSGEPEGLVVQTSGEFGTLESLAAGYTLPTITARTGVDLNPFPIDGKSDELRLTSYVWADQLERIERLRRALAILQDNKNSAAPVQLGKVELPGELPPFLERLPRSNRPLVIYNTYITQYFKDQRPEFDAALIAWAQAQQRPVLWLQWEPRVDWMGESITAEEFGWCAWSADVWSPSAADVWQSGTHQRFLLGWVHPHGLQARMLDGLAEFKSHFQP